jgi:acetylornithine deacetylase
MAQNNTINNLKIIEHLQKEAIDLLKILIAVPSFSKEEDKTADQIVQFLLTKNVKVERVKNNIWARNLHFDAHKPSLLLNSHHDTVKPNKGYTLDPYNPMEDQGKLFFTKKMIEIFFRRITLYALPLTP